MLKDDLKLSSSEDSDGEQVCSFNGFPKKNPWGCPGQGSVKLKSHGMFLGQPQVFLNVILGKNLCKQIEMLCFVEILIN